MEKKMSETKPIRVMIVDDHAVVRSGLAAFLLAFDDLELVAEAGSGEEALRLAARQEPDVVLMDLVMPGMDGAEATRAIRRQRPHCQIIALTSFREEDLVQRALSAGAISYLLKNVSAAELADAIRAADYIVDLGPGAGEHGGEVVVTGTLEDVMACPRSITGDYLAGRRRIPIPEQRRDGNGSEIVIKGAAEHNLKSIEVHIPLGKFVCITGVSGSGKSTLLVDILYRRLAQVLQHSRDKPGRHDAVLGVEHVDKAINIDQSPIGRTPRSNPATYTNVLTYIRDLFAELPESKVRGYAPGRFSFNVKGGRCEACKGHGNIKIEMQFLPDIYITCDVCKGKRYNRETLQVRYKGKNIADV
ncbi:MAG TPA: response regulator, partial [Anaerolineae bacterium]|nr:response regulator [Anaerolineae bacterium]